ncbi:MAG: transposase [Nitrososphaerota archaeon]|nr:transposase [Nitrososphaerota archaeon]
MNRAILLQTEATASKKRALSDFLNRATTEVNRILPLRQGYKNASEFQTAMAPGLKANAGFNIQVICDMARSAWGKHKNCVKVKGTTVKFNVPRNCKAFRTRRFSFVELGLYPGRRVAAPIRKNRDWDRLSGLLGSGWTCKTYGLTPSLEIVAYLSKKEKELIPRRNVLGIDINAKDFAYTILTPEGDVLKQGYLGQQMWPRKVHFVERRAMLQSLNALKKLKRMRHRQRDYVRTNIGQMVREVVILAKRYDADVSVERLSRFKPKGRRFNRKVMTIPLHLFRRVLEGRCFDNSITLNRVDAYHTSKWCTRCGAVGRGHDGGNYSLFRCRECGQAVNSDRKASLAVAVKTLLERNGPNQDTFQISGRRVPVSGLIRGVSDAPGPLAVPAPAQGRGKPTGFSRG